MKISALLDVELVALETDDEVSTLLEITAPDAPVDVSRAPASLQIVLDRSGSMSGAPLEGAKAAIVELIKRLDPTDNFGLVVFGHSAEVIVPAGPLTDKAAATAQVAQVHSRGSTDLSAGYLRGMRELRRVSTGGGTLLVVSDGHVNSGIQDHDEFAAIAALAYADGVVTSTLGYGLGYDETLLEVISRAGAGNHVFAADHDAASAAIAGEVDGLFTTVAQAVSLTFHIERSVAFAKLFNDLPLQHLDAHTVMVDLGNLYAGETRKVLCSLDVPAMAALGAATIATIELAFVELPELIERTVTVPLNVNVVPGDEAADRVPRPEVHAEVLVQQAQQLKRDASVAFAEGRLDDAQRLLAATRSGLQDALDAAPEDAVDDIRTDLADVERLAEQAATERDDADLGTRLAKGTRATFHTMNRQRGRRPTRPGRSGSSAPSSLRHHPRRSRPSEDESPEGSPLF